MTGTAIIVLIYYFFHLLLCYSLLFLDVFFILSVKFCLYLFQLLMNCAYTLDKKLYEAPESMKEQFPSDSWLAWPSNLLSSLKIRTSMPFLFSCHSPHWRFNPKTSEFSRALPSGMRCDVHQEPDCETHVDHWSLQVLLIALKK